MTKTVEKGKFIMVEGGGGSGKTSFVEVFRDKHPEFVFCREPGGTEFGEEVRKSLLAIRRRSICPEAEMFGFAAVRAELYRRVIQPNIVEGKNVMDDRSWPTTFAYQGGRSNLMKFEILLINAIAVGGLMPDCILYFDVDPTIGEKRRGLRPMVTDQFDTRKQEFQQQVRKNYKELGRIIWPIWNEVDASKSPEEVYNQALGILKRRKII